MFGSGYTTEVLFAFKMLHVGGGRREMTAKTHFNVRDSVLLRAFQDCHTLWDNDRFICALQVWDPGGIRMGMGPWRASREWQ